MTLATFLIGFGCGGMAVAVVWGVWLWVVSRPVHPPDIVARSVRLMGWVALACVVGGCQSTPPPPPAAWVPAVDDLVETTYCAKCPGQTGELYHTWLTAVSVEAGTYTVYADEWPGGIPVKWVRKVAPGGGKR